MPSIPQGMALVPRLFPVHFRSQARLLCLTPITKLIDRNQEESDNILARPSSREEPDTVSTDGSAMSFREETRVTRLAELSYFLEEKHEGKET